MLNYDSDGGADISEEQMKEAEILGLKVVQFVCLDSNEDFSLNFFAFVDFIPRIGEKIILEDETKCEVIDIRHKPSKIGSIIATHTIIYVYEVSTND